MINSKSVALHTLGCKLNFSETSAIGRLFENDGFSIKPFTDEADVYVINTCSVTENADKECRQLVRRIQRKSPEAMVVVIGCYAQLKPKEIAEIDGVDMVLGASEKFNITQHIKEFTKGDDTKICSCDIDEVAGFNSSFSLVERTRTFLKVQDGCSYNCSFCTIPLARGKSRSNTIDNVLSEIRRIEDAGVKEIVLTGINLGDFGKDMEGNKTGTDFLDLLMAIEEHSTINRYRISSIEPNLLTPAIIDFVANSQKIMPHFHIPLQSGSNKILGKMRRRYKRELYADRVLAIKKLMPHCCIGVDVITGFPGETDDDFRDTHDFLLNLDVSYFHVFTYSERANTFAITLPESVPVSVRNERTKVLRTLSYRKMQEFERLHRGQTRKVLFEGKDKHGFMEGYTDNYIKVSVPYIESMSNEIVDWQLR